MVAYHKLCNHARKNKMKAVIEKLKEENRLFFVGVISVFYVFKRKTIYKSS
jgi:hypothetical protein